MSRRRSGRVTQTWGPNAQGQEPVKDAPLITQGVRSSGFPRPQPASPDDAIRRNRGLGGWKPI